MTMSMEHLEEIGLFKPRDAAPAAPAASGSAPTKAPVPAPAPAAAPSKKEAKAAAKEADKKAAPAAPSGPPPAEKSAEELAKMSKEERKAYHLARRAAAAPAAASGEAKPQQLTKAQRRAMQEAQRKAKEDKAAQSMEGDELLKELILQGLTEEQARIVMKEMEETQVQEEDDDEDDEPEDLKSSVRKWMDEVDDKDLKDNPLHDFNMKVRFQGHVESTPPDHVTCVLQVMVDKACEDASFGSLKQPMAVMKNVKPAVVRWAKILEPLYSKIGDCLTAADTVVKAVCEAAEAHASVKEESRACIVVGLLMALRDTDMMEDEDLLTGCKRADLKSVVMDKFIAFLEEALEEDDDEDDDED